MLAYSLQQVHEGIAQQSLLTLLAQIKGMEP
jgi:hypothetical protein